MRHGFLLLNKPAGPTSHDIVATIRRTFGEKKIGHLGTLDPAATGLMVLAVGSKALKVVELFTHVEKEYLADITFGSVSSTYDRDGFIEKLLLKPGVPEPDTHAVLLALKDKFTGNIWQVPPAHSAIRVDGERAYKKAREGKAFVLPEREVRIDSCDIVSYDYPNLTLLISCSSGTYIRSIAHDLGSVLRCGGYLSGLRRTKVGDWSVENAVSPERAAWGHVIPLKKILADFPRLDLRDNETEDIRHGRYIAHDVQVDTIGWHDGVPIAILAPLKDGSRQAKGRKVF